MRCFGMLLDGRAQTTGVRRRGKEATLLLILNVHHDMVQFTLPECAGGHQWALLIDTQFSATSEGKVFSNPGDVYQVTAHSSLLFGLVPEQ